MNILEVKNLSVGFNIETDDIDGFFYALNNINLSFEASKIHAIAGESGCGKSVFINTILKLLPKNAEIKSGEIIFNNENNKTESTIFYFNNNICLRCWIWGI